MVFINQLRHRYKVLQKVTCNSGAEIAYDEQHGLHLPLSDALVFHCVANDLALLKKEVERIRNEIKKPFPDVILEKHVDENKDSVYRIVKPDQIFNFAAWVPTICKSVLFILIALAVGKIIFWVNIFASPYFFP